MRNIQAMELGGTLFIPANHKNLQTIVSGEKYTQLKSIVVDTEDSIAENDVKEVMLSLESMLEEFIKSDLFVFIRPRNVSILKTLLSNKNIDEIDGFVLPKFSLNNADEYLHALKNTEFSFMPSIEGEELFDMQKLALLKEKILPLRSKIILVRFGLEDMLRQLQMKREAHDSIFDFSVTNVVLGNFLALFKGDGFCVSGGVYPFFSDREGFIKDVQRDLKEGLVSKTIIHPEQIEPLNDYYKVSKKEYEEAKEVLESTQAVFNQDGAMAERTTQIPFSKKTLKRAEIYGLRKIN